MNRTGKMVYVPQPVLDKLLKIKNREGLNRRSDAWERMGKLADIGLNVDDFYSQLFGNKKARK